MERGKKGKKKKEEWRGRERQRQNGRKGKGRIGPKDELGNNSERGQRDGQNTIRDWCTVNHSKNF